jgi:hypothetical protein
VGDFHRNSRADWTETGGRFQPKRAAPSSSGLDFRGGRLFTRGFGRLTGFPEVAAKLVALDFQRRPRRCCLFHLRLGIGLDARLSRLQACGVEFPRFGGHSSQA